MSHDKNGKQATNKMSCCSMLLTVPASLRGIPAARNESMVLATPRLWVRLPGNACF